MRSPLKILIATAFAVALSGTLSAAPPGKGPLKTGTYPQASTVEEIQSIKPGMHYAVVCMECKSVTVKEAADEKEVAALCHDGGSMHCDSCKKKFTIKHVGPPGKGTSSPKVTIVNAEGKPCMFIVPMNG